MDERSRIIVFVPANLSYGTCLQICTVWWHSVYYRQDWMVLGKSGLLFKGTWLWPWSHVCVCVCARARVDICLVNNWNLTFTKGKCKVLRCMSPLMIIILMTTLSLPLPAEGQTFQHAIPVGDRKPSILHFIQGFNVRIHLTFWCLKLITLIFNNLPSTHIQGVTGGMDQTSGGCSLC
jgi:hypothetical protein